MSYVNDTYSYQILNPKGIKGIEDPKKCTKILIESTELAEDQYRLGNTKARNIFSFYTPKIYFEQKQMQMQNTLVYGSKTDVQTHTLTHTYLHTHTHSQYEKRCRTRIEGCKPRVTLLVCVCFHILLLSLYSVLLYSRVGSSTQNPKTRTNVHCNPLETKSETLKEKVAALPYTFPPQSHPYRLVLL